MLSAWVITSSDRPVYSSRSTWVNGSSRAPNRDFVRRTPLPTARTRPLRLVKTVTMRSASPSFWVRSTIPSSRYRLTLPLSRTAGPAPAQARAGNQGYRPGSRRAELTRSAAAGVVHGRENGAQRGRHRVRVDAHTPPGAAVYLTFHVGGRLRVAARGERVLGVVEHADLDPDGGQRVAERRDRPVAGPLDLMLLAVDLDVHGQRVLGVHDGGGVVREQGHRPRGQVLVGERLPHLGRGHLAAFGVGVRLDHPGELDLEPPG